MRGGISASAVSGFMWGNGARGGDADRAPPLSLTCLNVSKGVTSVCFVMYNVVRLKDSKGVKAVCSKSRFCGEAGEAVYAVWREIIWPVAGHTPQHFRS